jgi:hypothetical protein
LKSGLAIFSFDGDGIVAYGIPGNPRDSTGYGGPNVYFTNISADLTTGTANFIVPIAANGGSAYFSLEEAISSATACSSVINNSVPKPNPGGSPTVFAYFTPQFGNTLAEAAKLCGFIEFDWQSLITSLPQPAPYFYAAGSNTPQKAPPAYNDPPLSGYAYQNPPNAVELPVYWNLFTSASDPLSLAANESPLGANATTLSFQDTPSDPCLPGGSLITRAAGVVAGWAPLSCLLGAPNGSRWTFTTHVVGIAGALPGALVVDTGIGFDWYTTYNGTTGGIAVSNGVMPPDAGSGTGGVTVTSVNEITTYNGIIITTVNGAPAVAPTITSLMSTPSMLWPPNHQMVPVSVVVKASDGTATPPVCAITSVSSNELPSPGESDWIVTAPLAVELRSERAGGGKGRVYTIAVSCGNGSPFVASASAAVTVPHDQSN